jgi:Icc-related predicted phosphoesterase
MKLLTISDIHGQFGSFPLPSFPDADLALVCGDFTNKGIHRPFEVAAAEQWTKQMAVRYPKVLYVMGNHDLGLPNAYFERDGLAIQNIARKVTVLSGRRFVGADLSPCFDLPELAEDWERMTADTDVDAAYFDSLPMADIVVSHCPPLGVLDEFRRPGSGHHLGSPGLRRYIETVKPLLVVCGHIHEGSGEAMIGDTCVVNVARRCQLLEIPDGSLSRG